MLPCPRPVPTDLIYLKKYLRAKFEGTVTKPLNRVGKHIYPIISSKYEHSVNIFYTSSFLGGFGKIFCFYRWRQMLRLRLLRFGRFAAAVGVKLANAAPRICWVVSCVADAFLLMFLRTLVKSHLVPGGAWVCSCTCSTKSSMAFNFIFVLQFPFLRSIHSHEVSRLAKSFCLTYWYPFLINFLAPFSVKLNSMIASFN